jgi:hypothetical protein
VFAASAVIFRKASDDFLTQPEGELHDQGDNVRKYHYYLIVTETTKYAPRAADPRGPGQPIGLLGVGRLKGVPL